MRRVLFLLPLLFGGCSCQPQAGRETASNTASSAASGTAAAEDESQPDALANIPIAALSAVSQQAPDEPTTIRNYVNALMRGDRTAADAYWSGGGTRPDDQALRSLPVLRQLRVDADSPIARDHAEPSRLREVPVRIRMVTRDGSTLRYHGWYRLQPRPDGSAWEIQGASLQPTLD